jgi:hypothetical protein
MDGFSRSCCCRETAAQARKDIRLPHPYVDQHCHNEDDPDEDIDPVLGHAEALDIELQERADERYYSRACKRADHRAVAAED